MPSYHRNSDLLVMTAPGVRPEEEDEQMANVPIGVNQSLI